jgi:hypothetical protein
VTRAGDAIHRAAVPLSFLGACGVPSRLSSFQFLLRRPPVPSSWHRCDVVPLRSPGAVAQEPACPFACLRRPARSGKWQQAASCTGPILRIRMAIPMTLPAENASHRHQHRSLRHAHAHVLDAHHVHRHRRRMRRLPNGAGFVTSRSQDSQWPADQRMTALAWSDRLLRVAGRLTRTRSLNCKAAVQVGRQHS